MILIFINLGEMKNYKNEKTQMPCKGRSGDTYMVFTILPRPSIIFSSLTLFPVQSNGIIK